MNRIKAVGYENNELKEKAQLLADQLNLQLDQNADTCLFVTHEKLTLKIPNFSLMFADFSSNTWNKRKGEGKKQGLIRACKPTKGIKILDATAGWGKDAAILASFGADVVMLERHPVMAALLTDALSRRKDTDIQKMSLSLIESDAISFLHSLQEKDYPDIIYIDPMHPERSKSALVKKEMQVLQQLIGVDNDAMELIKRSLSHVKSRVVVKWPQKVKPLLPPDASIDGKTVRFDIYMPKFSSI
ncbi:class I SAM-dependent methyltransferase [Legionella pneumophila]|uniref:Ribosomal RNA small subunit methyltransferase J n=1 Tax=Legionella pneumophila subsp. pascullei TaxID=91890 RepID=A0AAX2IXW6_LEGPN|nr:class I SAM-dependent methyltransferase [Legionella pneumophila]AMP89519.1 SAM-dependent methyltransferase [Legionella pneumophila subsp. pascullei]AMP92815.1 SAM-dependent methyltransferase [Legionella pneumophila subsp. pascullei]AMP95781.1 SAM-dependent methyltransferase [Legionella pneumophila subsp. pascullei]SQG90696.1 N6-adenine-specific methylase [Legionella pneumophila subsp. pascullei]VEH07241.1 N6-adenine-specific methylase [Legionella pneumophila subsp. pascullei]